MGYKGSVQNNLPALRHKLYSIDKRKRKLRFDEYRMQRHIEYLDILYKRSRGRRRLMNDRYVTHNAYQNELLYEIEVTSSALADVQDELYNLYVEQQQTQSAIQSTENPIPPEVIDDILENDDPFLAQEIIDWEGPEWIDPL